MDKVSRIAAAALIASTMAVTSPAFAVETTAEDFVASLSTDFSRGDYATVLAKLNELQRLGLDGIVFDDQMISIEQLIALLNQVQAGGVSGANAAATLLAYLDAAAQVRFVNGGILTTTADIGPAGGFGSVFPAGSAG